MRGLRLVLLFWLLIVPFWAQAQTPFFRPFEHSPGFVGYVENEFVIVLRPEARASLSVGSDASGRFTVNLPSLQRTMESEGVEGFVREFPTARPQVPGSRFVDLTGHYLVRLSPGSDIDRAIMAFEADPSVDHVEKIGIHTMTATPNDTYYQNPPPTFPYDQWHYWGTHGIDADLAWDMQTGDAGVVVGILDSGVRYFHVDLGGNSAQWGPSAPFADGNIWLNPNEIPANSVDDDANGFVDDAIGWDFVSSAGGGGVTCIDQDCSGVDNDPDDGDGHGTHVAGTVGAITNNGRSVAGIAGGFSGGLTTDPGNGIEILPLRIGYHARYLGQVVGIVRMDWAAQAMNYVSDLVDAGVNVAAVNCSWGSSNSGGLDAAVNNLLARDVMIVHAAGNDNSDLEDYLGGKPGVMNVAATDSTGAGASFTNYGSWVDVAAPGVDIMSTYRNPDDPDPTHHYVAVSSGTSMSAPHICGIAALLESCDSELSGPEKFDLIVDNTTPYTDARDLGSGIANANLALIAAGCNFVPCDIAAGFTASPTSGEEPLEVQFTDLSTGAETWEWHFGDDSTSTDQNPLHTYEDPDTYTVTLIVTNYCGEDTLIMTDYIGVTQTMTAVGDTPLLAGATTWAYPNPFNPGTDVFFRVDRPGNVRIVVYDAAGRAVRTLVAGAFPGGIHRAYFNARDDGGRRLASGVYFYRFEAPGTSEARKIVLLK